MSRGRKPTKSEGQHFTILAYSPEAGLVRQCKKLLRKKGISSTISKSGEEPPSFVIKVDEESYQKAQGLIETYHMNTGIFDDLFDHGPDDFGMG